MQKNNRWIYLSVVSVVLLACSIGKPTPPVLIPDAWPPPSAMPYRITVLPNPRINEGIMAMVPTESNVTQSRAASMAAFQRRRYSARQMSRWRRFYIFVFKDAKTAAAFNRYQAKRKNAPLQNADYIKLQNVWAKTLVRYEWSNKKEYVVYPSKNPRGWWKVKTR